MTNEFTLNTLLNEYMGLHASYTINLLVPFFSHAIYPSSIIFYITWYVYNIITKQIT